MEEKKKKGRTMSKEMLEKLALARAKGLAKIQENRKKFKELQAKEHAEGTFGDSDQDNSDYSQNSIIEKSPPPPKAHLAKVTKPPKVCEHSELRSVAKTTTPTPPKVPLATPQAKYNGVKKIKKTKVIYLTDSETEEEEIIAKPPRKTAPKVPSAKEKPIEDDVNSLDKEYTKINNLLTKYNM